MASERWTVDPGHSGIHFAVRHLVIAKVRGQFTRWTGTIDTAQGTLDHPAVEVVIDAGSIETGVADRDAHLKSPDFLDAAQFPELRFTSTRFVPSGASGGQLVGALTIKGTTREVVLDVERLGTAKDPWGNERAAFSAKTVVDRRDFGLTWNQALETGGVLVGERVEIDIEIEAVKQPASKVA